MEEKKEVLISKRKQTLNRLNHKWGDFGLQRNVLSGVMGEKPWGGGLFDTEVAGDSSPGVSSFTLAFEWQ